MASTGKVTATGYHRAVLQVESVPALAHHTVRADWSEEFVLVVKVENRNLCIPPSLVVPGWISSFNRNQVAVRGTEVSQVGLIPSLGLQISAVP